MGRHPGSRGLFELPAIAGRDAGWLGESDDREVTLSALCLHRARTHSRGARGEGDARCVVMHHRIIRSCTRAWPQLRLAPLGWAFLSLQTEVRHRADVARWSGGNLRAG